jgi:hypothetical protein
VGKWFEQYNYLKHQGDDAFEDIGEYLYLASNEINHRSC